MSQERKVEIDRDKRDRWSWNVRINGKPIARCGTEDEARTIADALRNYCDGDSAFNKLSRIQSQLRILSQT
jgi:hypothetical protein